jgi:hypothetical protein
MTPLSNSKSLQYFLVLLLALSSPSSWALSDSWVGALDVWGPQQSFYGPPSKKPSPQDHYAYFWQKVGETFGLNDGANAFEEEFDEEDRFDFISSLRVIPSYDTLGGNIGVEYKLSQRLEIKLNGFFYQSLGLLDKRDPFSTVSDRAFSYYDMFNEKDRSHLMTYISLDYRF